MQLIVILLAVVSVLTFLSGAIVFFGASKGDRGRSAWFFAASIFSAIWAISISAFLTTTTYDLVDWHVAWSFVGAIALDAAFLGYVAWHEKYGKVLTAVFVVFGLILSGLIFACPNCLYQEIIISNVGNSVTMNLGPLYFTYIAFFCLIIPAIIVTFFKQYSRTRSKRKRNGDFTIMIAFAISSLLILIADLILPFFNIWRFVWIGPLALSATIIAFYYTILRYRSLNLSSIWLRIFSYVVIIASVAIIYMIIFAIIFAALFRGSTPSTEVIVLNFIMILIFLLLMPALSQFSGFIRNLIANQTPHNKKGKD